MVASDNQDLTERFIDFYREYYEDEIGQLAQKYPNERRSLYIDYDDLYVFDKDLAEDYRKQPDQFQEYAEEALRNFDLPADIKLGQAHVRIENLPSSIDIRELRVSDDHIGSLISISGIVRKATDVTPKMTDGAFMCERCGTINYIPQMGGDFQEPHECQACERQGPFNINFDQSEFVDAQQLRIQESPEGLRGGETPQHMDVSIEDDITGEVTPGDHVTVVGVLHIERQSSNDSNNALFETYMDGVSISFEDEEFEDMDISDSDITEIERYANQDDIYEKMVGSIAPSIYGYNEEKLSMVLQLFSGITKHLPDGSRIRGDLHMLLIGDPGTGKSKLLSYVGNLAPRSVYTSGKGSSTAGLTAAAVQSDFGDGEQWTLEAGALVLADKGIAAIDELDKMKPSDRSAMHEALEQQTVSIAKAGINATLKSRCSLLGAANPQYGRFDQYQPTAEQIDLEPALISRFDLIFTVSDNPDPEHDANLADHILEANYAGEMNTQREEMTDPNHSEQEVVEATREVSPEIDKNLLQKYIAHSKRTCFPTMTAEAKAHIKEFYVDLRERGSDVDDPIPVTARKLEALVRLAEASARVRLSETVDEQDAERAVSIVRSCLEDIGIDPETGEFDADVIETGTSKTQRDRIQSLRMLISDIAEDYETGAPIEKVVERGDEVGIEDEQKIKDEIEKLRRQGEVYEPKQNHIRTT